MDFVHLSLQVVRWQAETGFESLVCGQCEAPLAFHQPEPRTPGRILATCEECDSWYLLDVSRRWMLRLPEGELGDPGRKGTAQPKSEIATM